jgi:hypothetical protein
MREIMKVNQLEKLVNIGVEFESINDENFRNYDKIIESDYDTSVNEHSKKFDEYFEKFNIVDEDGDDILYSDLNDFGTGLVIQQKHVKEFNKINEEDITECIYLKRKFEIKEGFDLSLPLFTGSFNGGDYNFLEFSDVYGDNNCFIIRENYDSSYRDFVYLKKIPSNRIVEIVVLAFRCE